MSDELLKVEVKYYPYTEPQHWFGDATTFTYDQCKMNLLWLVHPDVDNLHDKVWAGDMISEHIDEGMYKDLRNILRGPPIEMMRDFEMFHGYAYSWGDLIDKLCKGFPTAFRHRMWDRAKEANARLCEGLGPNVYKVDFKSKKKYG
jgi:hypothetical protein